MRIIFMGTPSFSLPALSALHQSKNTICSIYTQPPKNSGRGHKLNQSAVHKFGILNNIEVKTPKKLTKEIDAAYIKKIKADIGVVVAYGLILPKSILTAPLFGFINIHASLLPRWRGAAPIQRAILEGDQKTGITIMRMNSDLDAGNIISCKEVKINPITNFSKLEKILSEMGAVELMKVLNSFSGNRFDETQQNEKLATYANKIEKKESKIIWSNSSAYIDRQVRAFSIYPGAWSLLNGKRLKILEGEAISQPYFQGEVSDNLFTIGCGDFSYRPSLVQLEGKKVMKVAEFLRGAEVNIGTKLG